MYRKNIKKETIRLLKGKDPYSKTYLRFFFNTTKIIKLQTQSIINIVYVSTANKKRFGFIVCNAIIQTGFLQSC